MQIVNDGIGTYFSHIINALNAYIVGMTSGDLLRLGICLAGQCLFKAHSILQWIHYERHGKSLMPVIILGQLPSTIVYTRNLRLTQCNAKQTKVESS